MKQSAGLLIYRSGVQGVEVFLVHPGGPYWANKDIAAWSIPKGEFEVGEDPLKAAIREFIEETGLDAPEGEPIPLTSLAAGRKRIHAWVFKSDLDAQALRSNMFEMEWPPKSGRLKKFPEVDKAGWFSIEEARDKLHKGHVPLIQQLLEAIQS